MNKTILSLLLSFVLGGTLLAGLLLGRRGGNACPTCATLAGDLSAVQQTLTALREETAALREEIQSHPAAPPALARSAAAVEPSPAAREVTGARPAPAVATEAIKTSVLLALAEDREQREAQRQEERDAARQAAEARRQGREALQTGPYDKLNLKVNSLGNVLQLTDAQKQAYYEAVKASRDRLKETMKQAAEAARAEGQAAEGGRGGGMGGGREAWSKLRESRDAVQKELEGSLAAIFTPAQLETYNQLSRSARDVQDAGEVNAPGEGGGADRRQTGFPGTSGGRGGNRSRGGAGFGGR